MSQEPRVRWHNEIIGVLNKDRKIECVKWVFVSGMCVRMTIMLLRMSCAIKNKELRNERGKKTTESNEIYAFNKNEMKRKIKVVVGKLLQINYTMLRVGLRQMFNQIGHLAFQNSSDCVYVAYAIESREQPATYSLTYFEIRIEQVLSSNDKCTCSMHAFPILTEKKNTVENSIGKRNRMNGNKKRKIGTNGKVIIEYEKTRL